MGKPLSPSSSQEIIPISPPVASSSRLKPMRRSSLTTLPQPEPFDPPSSLKEKIVKHVREQTKKEDTMSGKRKAGKGDHNEHRQKMGNLGRSRQTEVMMSTLGKGVNPITNSDLYSRTDHFISAATGHQQSNRGGGSGGAATYWEVRTAKMTEQARDQKTDILKGCVFYINGSTGPRVSNLQLQHIITVNGGRFLPMQSSSCTHTITSNLSGTKMQKYINGQGGRGASRRSKVVRVDCQYWILDSIEKGTRVSEAGYGVVEDPSQKNLFSAFGVRPKVEMEKEIDSSARKG